VKSRLFLALELLLRPAFDYNLYMQITVLGKGVFGQAIGSLLEYNKVEFSYVDINIPMTATPDWLFVTVPTQFIRPALEQNKSFFKPYMMVVNCAKGIEKDTHALPYYIISTLLCPAGYFSLIGPSFAEEIVQKSPTMVSLGYAQDEHLDYVLSLVQTPYFRLQPSKDYAALELSSALKNVYAIMCGYADGLGYRMNTRAQLITLALQEFSILAHAMDIEHHGLAQPGLVGDLVLTCTSTESRNFSFGYYLATMSAEEALAKAGSTVEGYYTSISIQALSKKYTTLLPLATLTHTLIEQGKNGATAFSEFLGQQ
jgi:glycerol-3-phosphate dehydrogenase (NAD(P)+)